jgi:hypothetical protein
VIARIHPRRRQVVGVLRYLFGPGERDEHVRPRLVAVWDGAGDLADLEPPVQASGRRDVRALAELLMQPVRAAANPPATPVWHCSIRNAVTDRVLSDERWAHVANRLMAAVGLAPPGDDRAVRWVAVRHSDDHVHLVATLVRQDGRTAWAWRDRLNARRVCRQLEDELDLVRTGPADHTGHQRPSPVELNKARRLARAETGRDELRRRVRAAAAAAVGEGEFFARLADLGVLARRRESTIHLGEFTGYTVALKSHTTARGEPVWYAGGSLARDLTLPKLRHRWARPPEQPEPTVGAVRVTAGARAEAMHQAAQAIRAAADAIRHLATRNPAAAQAVAQAASDTLTALAATVEAHRRGPLTRAVDLFDKATRLPAGEVAAATTGSARLRSLSRLVYAMGRAGSHDDSTAMLALVHALADFADTVADLREAQQRLDQARAARTVAQQLRAAAHAGGRLGPATPALTSVDPAAAPRSADPTASQDPTRAPSTRDTPHGGTSR